MFSTTKYLTVPRLGFINRQFQMKFSKKFLKLSASCLLKIRLSRSIGRVELTARNSQLSYQQMFQVYNSKIY